MTVIDEDTDAPYFLVTGHRGGDQGGIDGAVTRVSAAGQVLWSRSYGDPAGGEGPLASLDGGNPQLIFDECWGIQGLADGGAVIACGTGIEGCDEYARGSALRTECEADPRTTWRSMLVRIDAAGEEIWTRLDAYTEAGEAAETASEYVFLTTSGQIASVMDQGFGIGLLLLDPEDVAKLIKGGVPYKKGEKPKVWLFDFHIVKKERQTKRSKNCKPRRKKLK